MFVRSRIHDRPFPFLIVGQGHLVYSGLNEGKNRCMLEAGEALAKEYAKP